MRKHFLGTMLGVALLAAPVVAQEDRRGSQANSSATAGTESTAGSMSADQKNSREGVQGRIKEYTPGQRITVSIPNGLDKSYDLADQSVQVTVAVGLKEGDSVTLFEREQAGTRTIRIEPAASASGMASSPSGTTSGTMSGQSSSSAGQSSSGTWGQSSGTSGSGTSRSGSTGSWGKTTGSTPGSTSSTPGTTSSSQTTTSGTATTSSSTSASADPHAGHSTSAGQTGSTAGSASGQTGIAGTGTTDSGTTIYGKVKNYKSADRIEIDVDNAPDRKYDLKSTDQQVMVASDVKKGDQVRIVERDSNGARMVHIERADSAVAGREDSSGRTNPRTDEPKDK